MKLNLPYNNLNNLVSSSSNIPLLVVFFICGIFLICVSECIRVQISLRIFYLCPASVSRICVPLPFRNFIRKIHRKPFYYAD